MNEDFLHRLRAKPPPEFLANLKAKLDRQSGEVLAFRPRLLRTLAAGVLIGASAIALAQWAMRGDLGRLRDWFDPKHPTQPEPGATHARETGTGTRDPREAVGADSLRSPWTVALPPTTDESGGKSVENRKAIVAVPQRNSLAPSPTVARYAGVTSTTATQRKNIRVIASADTRFFTQQLANRFESQTAGTQGRSVEVAIETSAEPLNDLCAGTSADIAAVSRTMTAAEADACAPSRTEGGVVEIKLGYETVVLVRSKLYGALTLKVRDIYLALAKTIPDASNPTTRVPNPNKTWNQIDSALPYDPIEVLGPDLDSASGRAFVALIMEAGCRDLASPASTKELGEGPAAARCTAVREDGPYILSAPSMYPAFIQQLQMKPTAIGVMGFASFVSTGDELSAVALGNIVPTHETIVNGTYPAARARYLDVSLAHARSTPDVFGFIMSSLAGLENGLAREAIVLPDPTERAAIRARAVASLNSKTQIRN